MRSRKAAIPHYRLPDYVKAGVEIHTHADMVMEVSENHDLFSPHRDDHYLLAISFDGLFHGTIDFKSVEMSGSFILMILPGQVHLLKEVTNARAYTVSFDTSLVPAALKPYLDQWFAANTGFRPTAGLLEQLDEILEIMIRLKDDQHNGFKALSLHGLLQAMLALIAENLDDSGADFQHSTRAAIINREFQQLLQNHFKEWKSPGDYAGALHITPTHLNDTIKDITGLPVSQHIQQLVVLEAKRMLYHTGMTVTEIAYDLGYEDVGYFTRLFKKVTGSTALMFRKQFRE
ncbi:AraC family transcriptional regulator [Chitinophaga sp. sic0106]|uniref:helix-turn-helix domain-containing protein n=1 Tax=Chitinophaga sp. sic0106 TaxID=2854785 RepID=UPI001C48E763|nr:helix-turn-helix domain-containing protein [Chitinophaga sp. sic0106]MBV7529825.1 helix-turn-helix domain-containing protein [Chitinophaga sp. sic0106]